MPATRSVWSPARGVGPEHPGVERVAADAADADQLAELAAGAATIFNCANPPYHKWAVGVAAAGRDAVIACRRGIGCPTGHDEQPVRLRRRQSADACDRRTRSADPQGGDPRRDVAGGARRPRGRPDPNDRGAGVGLHRAGRRRQRPRRRPFRPSVVGGQERVGTRPLGCRAQLELRRRRGEHPGRGRRRRPGARSGLARADRPAADRRAARRRVRRRRRDDTGQGEDHPGCVAEGRRVWSARRSASCPRCCTSSSGRSSSTPRDTTDMFGIEPTPLTDQLRATIDSYRQPSAGDARRRRDRSPRAGAGAGVEHRPRSRSRTVRRADARCGSRRRS